MFPNPKKAVDGPEDKCHYKCYKINLKRGRLYIDSPDWIKKQKSDNKFYQ